MAVFRVENKLSDAEVDELKDDLSNATLLAGSRYSDLYRNEDDKSVEIVIDGEIVTKIKLDKSEKIIVSKRASYLKLID